LSDELSRSVPLSTSVIRVLAYQHPRIANVSFGS